MMRLDELMDGHWYEDEDGFLYLVGDECEVEGPDNEISFALGELYRGQLVFEVDPWAVALALGIQFVPGHLRRHNEVDGYYHA